LVWNHDNYVYEWSDMSTDGIGDLRSENVCLKIN